MTVLDEKVREELANLSTDEVCAVRDVTLEALFDLMQGDSENYEVDAERLRDRLRAVDAVYQRRL